MIFLTLSKCPASLRGDVTKWLFEVSAGVYIGKVNARVREELWKRIKRAAPHGQATMVWNVKNEQGFDFRVHNSQWEPIDFDGLKLMMHPNLQRQKEKNSKHLQSNARRFFQARNGQKHGAQNVDPPYVVVDVETTGLTPENNDVIELGAIRIQKGRVIEEHSSLVIPSRDVPDSVQKLTGISTQMLKELGVEPKEAIEAFCSFIGNDLLVSHNIAFDLSFLNEMCKRYDMALLENETEDTFRIAKKILYNLGRYRLSDVAEHLGVAQEQQHRALADCHVTFGVYEKLLEIKVNENS